ncbi:hypothetical protein MHBO_002215 [Bonamia ostreae]|uniref:Uncharacterized protein n=1 Tax=Bonamia ostreae TaxID=126728 RepID=A0ABV2ALM4_9EUKA
MLKYAKLNVAKAAYSNCAFDAINNFSKRYLAKKANFDEIVKKQIKLLSSKSPEIAQNIKKYSETFSNMPRVQKDQMLQATGVSDLVKRAPKILKAMPKFEFVAMVLWNHFNNPEIEEEMNNRPIKVMETNVLHNYHKF